MLGGLALLLLSLAKRSAGDIHGLMREVLVQQGFADADFDRDRFEAFSSWSAARACLTDQCEAEALTRWAKAWADPLLAPAESKPVSVPSLFLGRVPYALASSLPLPAAVAEVVRGDVALAHASLVLMPFRFQGSGVRSVGAAGAAIAPASPPLFDPWRGCWPMPSSVPHATSATLRAP